MRNRYIKFQNSSIHSSKPMLCTYKQQDYFSLKLQTAISPTTFHLIDRKFNQVISTSVPIKIPNIKALAQIFLDILLTRFQFYFIAKEITLKWEKNWIREKYWSPIFFMRNPYMKFQNISIYGSKLMLCT